MSGNVQVKFEVRSFNRSKFGEDRSKTELTILAVVAGRTDTGRTLKLIYILSNALHCIGQTKKSENKRRTQTHQNKDRQSMTNIAKIACLNFAVNPNW